MFTKYVCEECGKTFAKEEEALQCEREHADFKKAAEEAEAERKEKVDEIKAIEALLKGKIDSYEKTYGIKYYSKGNYYGNLNDIINELFGA